MAASSDRTQVALIGAGFIAEFHHEILAKLPSVTVSAVVDADLARAQSLARRKKIPHAFASIAEMVAKEKPDVAHVLVPPSVHAVVTRELLEHGIAAFCEKPFGVNQEECRELVELAESKNVPLGVNHNNLFHPSFVGMKQILESAKLGRVEHLFACLHVPLRQLNARDFKHWMFQDSRNIVFEQGPHPLSQVHDLLGDVRSMSVLRSGRQTLGPGLVFYDTWQISAQCEKGPATILLSFGKDFASNWLHLIGQDGSVQVDLLRRHGVRWFKTPWLDFYDQLKNAAVQGFSLFAQGIRNASDYVLSTLKLKGRTDVFYLGMKGSITAFHQAFRAGQPLPVTGRHGLEIVEICERVTAGAGTEEGEVLPLPREPAEGKTDEVLVTGATGFVGHHLVQRLRADGVALRLLVRRPDLLPENLRGDDISVVAGDINNEDAIDRAVRGTRAVIHLATGGGDTWEDVERTMVGGCRLMAEACLRHDVDQFFFTSTIAALYLGNATDGAVTNDTPVDPQGENRSLYARGKIACEKLLATMAQDQGLPVTVFRPGVVVGELGPVQHSGVGLWTRDSQCFGWGFGNNALPFVLVNDVADALALALGKSVKGKTYNLVGDARVTAREYVDVLRRRAGRDFQFHGQPLWWFQAIEIFKWMVKVVIRRPNTVFPSYRDLKTRALARPFDCSGTKQDLGWSPVSDREEFLSQCLDWFVDAGLAPQVLGESSVWPSPMGATPRSSRERTGAPTAS